MTVVVLTIAAVLVAAAAVALVRIVRGPSVLDRAVATEVLISIAVCALGVEAVTDPDESALTVLGVALEVVGDLAARNAITLHELSSQQASLEEAYLKLTDDAVEYRAAEK